MANTSCHRALRLPDILATIFDSLVWTMDWHGDKQNRQTCRNATLVSQLFYEPAASVLWRRIGSPYPLWNLLLPEGTPPVLSPPEIVLLKTPNVGEYMDSILQAKRHEDHQCWTQFLRCAQRIRSLSMACREWSTNTTQYVVIRVLVEYNGGKTFMPGLQRLSWFHNDELGDSTTLRLISPPLLQLTLQSCSVHRHHVEDALAYFTSILPPPSHAPHLIQLDLELSGAVIYETIADVLSPYRKLRGVSLDPSNHQSFWSLLDYDRICLSPSSLEKLLNALELERLDIWVGGFDGRAPYARPLQAQTLRTLRCSGKCSDFSGLAASLISPSLCWVAFIDTVSHSLEHSELSALFQAISSPHFSQSLSTLRVNVSCSASPGERLAEIGDSVATTATATFTTVFKPCLSLSQLTSLQFFTSASDDGVWLPVTDDDLRAVAKAMPKLQPLTLLCFSPPNRSRSSPLTCPTLLGILHLAERCPELTELILSAIDFSLVDIPIPPSLVSGGHHLTRLLLAACLWLSDEVPEVEEPLALAGLLTRVFPKLEQHLTVRFPARRWQGPLKDIVKALVDLPESYNADGQRPPHGVISY